MGQFFSCLQTEEIQENRISENTNRSVSVLGASSATEDENTLVPEDTSTSFTTAKDKTFDVSRPLVLHTSTPI